MILSRRAKAEFLDRDLDDFRWMKKLMREQIMRELNGLKVKPVFKTEPWLHQLVCFYIAICQPRFLFLLDMGLGKSKILTDVITQLQRERKLEGALITVPRMINMDSWTDDLIRHSDLEPWACNVSDTYEKWERLAYPKGDVTIIDYAGLTLAVCKREKLKASKTKKLTKKYNLVPDDKKIKHLIQQYNFIGVDESHKLSNQNNLWFDIVDRLTSKSEFCYATTGTLFGSDPAVIWPQFYLVDGGETFGENLGLFRASFFDAKINPWKGVTYVYKNKMDKPLNDMLQHRSLRYEESEVQDLPKLVSRVQQVNMADEQREHYMRALQGLVNANGVLAEQDASWLRMRQIVSGYLAWKDEHGDHVLRFNQNPKLDALEALLDGMGDSKIVICYDYTETGRMITDRVKSMGLDFEWYYAAKDKSAARRRFMTDPKCRVFVMNSEAGGTGNDGLQKVSRYMVFYESPTPPTTRKQTEKRIHRPGQTERVFIYDLVMRRSLDKGILEDIQAGVDSHNRVVNGRIKKNFLLGV